MVWRRAVKAAAKYAWRNRRRLVRAGKRYLRARSRRMRTVGRGRGRVFIPRIYGRPRSRVYRKLARRINRLRNVIDVDTTFNDVQPENWQILNYSGVPPGGTVAVPSISVQSRSYLTEMASLLQAGNRYRLKSFNERYSLSMGPVNSQDAAVRGVRHMRIMYLLMKDEELPVTGSGESAQIDLSQIFSPNEFSLRGPLAQNQGITYRILYDKTFSIASNSTKEFMIRFPARLFYDYGQIKFSPITGDQTNNYLYRIVFTDSLPVGTYSNSTDGAIHVFTRVRFKYYDFGGKQVADLSGKVKQLETAVKDVQEQLASVKTDVEHHTTYINSNTRTIGEIKTELLSIDTRLDVTYDLAFRSLRPETDTYNLIRNRLFSVTCSYIPSATSAAVKTTTYSTYAPPLQYRLDTLLGIVWSFVNGATQYAVDHATQQHRGEQPTYRISNVPQAAHQEK